MEGRLDLLNDSPRKSGRPTTALDEREAPVELTEGMNPIQKRVANALWRSQNPLPRETRPGATRFSTEYAIKWAKALGWQILDRERYDARLKRHHDLILGSDAMALSPSGVVLIQGAGRHERPQHRRRFDERGGVPKAEQAKMRFVYLEFERGDLKPKLEEWWA